MLWGRVGSRAKNEKAHDDRARPLSKQAARGWLLEWTARIDFPAPRFHSCAQAQCPQTPALATAFPNPQPLRQLRLRSHLIHVEDTAARLPKLLDDSENKHVRSTEKGEEDRL
eukprot:scaffold33108_cov129-Isochrysis_galbana.AAC.2